ncbi:hypothetical protein [uncultured Pseudoalteromonas sp.]|uniref:hypothetical protein n=1 Tax=uncultured Pseudoalteromonas sp. TaxID=114053 RepID=UPI0030DA4A9A
MTNKAIAKFNISATAASNFQHEADATADFWSNKSLNTLPLMILLLLMHVIKRCLHPV